MKNKLCVVTGANSGIGFEISKGLLNQGAYLVMVCRNEDKAEAAKARLIQETGERGIDIVLCDFSIQAEIRKAAKEIQQQYKSIDVLINNHGFIASERNETVDGLEETFAVNHIGYFLFTNLLLPQVLESEKGRIVNVASDAHRYGEFNPQNLQLEKGFTVMKAYGNSKLFNILFTKELADRIKHTNVTANCVHPGVVASNFGKKSNILIRFVYKLGTLFMISNEKGAETPLYLATSDDVEGVNGAYFKNKRAVTPKKQARDTDAAQELWEISEELVGLKQPEIQL